MTMMPTFWVCFVYLHQDDISPEDQDALEQALLAVIDTLGEPEECGISERRMKEALWETLSLIHI